MFAFVRRAGFPLISALLLCSLLSACGDNDPVAPGPGGYSASVSGTRSMSLTGVANAMRVYSEVAVTGRFTVALTSPGSDGTRVIVIDCPNDDLRKVGTFNLGSNNAGCVAEFRLVKSTPETGPYIQDVVRSTSGSVTITAVSAASITGRFDFAGAYMAGTNGIGNANVSGAFDAFIQGS